MRHPITIVLLRRNPETLSEAEKTAIARKFPDWDHNYVRTDPRDAVEHLADCRRLKPVMVLLPSERPIPSLAMEQGFAHCSFDNVSGDVWELEPLKPSFKIFVARRPPMKPMRTPGHR